MPAAPSTHSSRLSLRSPAVLNVLFFLAAGLLLLLIILHRTHGHFSYCLDDPYIHLALAERLRHGLYGINAGEPASPSSSILWPLLFVPFAGTALMPWMPLLLNTVFGAATAWLLGRFVERVFAPGWRAVGLGLLLVIGLNLLGIAYTGMEHPLQVLLCVASAFAALAVLDGDPIPRWSIAAALLLPSVRYEGVLITFVVAVALWSINRRRLALALLPVSLVPAALFSLYLHSQRLPWFPLSVLVKSSYKFQDHSSLPVRVIRLIVETLLATLRDPERAPEFLIVIALAWLAWRSRRTPGACLVLAATAAAGTVQVFLGPVGWFYRYEIYCLAFTLLIAIAADMRLSPSGLHPGIPPSLDLTAPAASSHVLTRAHTVPGMLLVTVGALAMFYARPQLGISQAALGIWQEQAQLGRFASQFHTGPVALNDLGWVSFLRRPDQYTLDLVGLGSYEAFKIKERDRTPTWLDNITREHSVGLVMVYPEWFPKGIPASWTPVAKLCANDVDPSLSATAPRVMFYATPIADRERLLAELQQFRPTLPPGSVLQLNPPDSTDKCSAGK